MHTRKSIRNARFKAIERKERILAYHGGQATIDAFERGAPGRLSKGKIHCSCPLCSVKSSDFATARDLRYMANAKDQIRELNYINAIDPIAVGVFEPDLA